MLVEINNYTDRREALKNGRKVLKSGSGDGTSDVMEARVAVLETHVEIFRRDVAELRTDMRDVRDRLRIIETDIKHLPTKSYIKVAIMGLMAFGTALITFQQQIQQFVHIATIK